MIVFLVPPGEEEVVTMDELTVAKISRCRLRGDAVSKICFLWDDPILTELHNIDIDIGQVTLEQTTELLDRWDKAKEALDKYTEAVTRCAVLEGKEDYDPDDEHMAELEGMEDDLDQLNYEIQDLRMMVREEESTRARAEANAHEEPGNIVAKPPHPMEKGITLDEMETWSSTWEDYYQVTKLEKEIPALQKPNLKSHLSVEHVLGIGPDSTKTCDKILGDLCNQSLDDRILIIKIMTGLSDHESREELLDRVSTPELEEANGAMRLHEDPAWTWMVKLYSRSVIVTVFDRGKSPQEDTGRSPREDFDMTKHDMTNCCLVGWREG